MPFSHLCGFVIRSVSRPRLRLRRGFFIFALGLLPLLAGQAQAQEITTTVEVVAADEFRVDFSAPVNVAASGEANFASSALNPAHWLFRGSAIRTGTTITPNGDGTSITFLFRITSGGNIIADPLTGSNFFGLAPGPGGLSSITGSADPTRRVRGFSISVSPPGPEAELSASLALIETGLVGETVTVNLVRTEFEPASGGAIIPGNFTLTLTGGATGVTVTGVTRDSATAATLTLGYDGTDLTAATTLSVTVLDAAHTASGNLTTNTLPINTSPVITNPGEQTYLIDAPITALPITVVDAEDQDSLVIDATGGLPTGLSYSAANSEITGTPTVLGTSTVTIFVDDGVNVIQAMDTFVINVVATLGAVNITAPSAAVAEAALDGTMVTLTFSATTLANPLPATPFTLDAASIAAGITVAATPAPARTSATTATFSLAYAAVGNGLASGTTHNVSVIVAADAHTLTGVLTSANTLAVTSTNQSPAFADGVTIADQVWEQNRSITPLTLPEATGGNGGPVSYLFSPNLPDGMTLTNRVLSGAPGNLNDTGTYSWFASDTDSDTSDSDAAVLSFNVRLFEPLTFGFATPPEASDLVYLVDEAISITLPEADGGISPLVYEAARISAGDFAGLVFDPATRVVSGSRDTAGQVPLEYSVTDARPVTVDYSPALSLTIEVNTMPIFSQGQDIPDMVYIVNEEITPVTLPAVDPGTGNAPITHFFPTSTSPGLPPGLTFNRMTRVLSGTPDTEGTTSGIIYRAFDRNNDFTDKTTGNNEITFSIIVEADAMPDFTGVTVDDVFITRDRPVPPLTLPAAIGGNGVVMYRLTGILQIVGITLDPLTRVLSGTTFLGARTVSNIRYRATDADGDVAEEPLLFTIEDDLTPSFAAIPAQEYLVDTPITALSLPATGGNRGLTYALAATPDLHDGLTFNAPANAGDAPTITGTPTAVGDARTYTITATDADGSEASRTFVIAVVGPEASITAPVSLRVDEADLNGATITVTLANSEYETTLDATHFSLGGTASISNTVTIMSATRITATTADLVLEYGSNGDIMLNRDLTVIVADAGHTGSGDLTTTNTLTIVATPDLTPTFSDTINPLTYTVGTAFSVTLPAATGGDPPLTYSIANRTVQVMTSGTLPDGLTFNNAADSRVLSGTPVNVQSALAYTYTATDSDTTSPDSAALEFTITIVPSATDLMPTFGSNTIGDLIYTVDTNVSVTLLAATGGDGALTHAITETLPTGMSFDAATRVLDGTPTVVAGSAAYTYTATDSDATAPDVASLGFTITIEADATPTFGAATIPDQAYAATEDVGTVTLPTATGGNRTLAYTLTPPLPANLSFDGTATPPTITGTPAAMAASVEYTYTATDGDVSTAVLTFALIIHPAPVVIGRADGTTVGTDGNINEDDSSTGGDLRITNAGGRSTQFIIQIRTTGTYGAFALRADGGWSYALNITNPAVRALNVGDSLTDTFTVTAAASPPTVTRDVVITINGVNDSPTGDGITTPAGDITAAHDQVIPVRGSGTDVDNADLIYTWSTSPANTGSFGDNPAAETTWTAPPTDADVTLMLRISDGILAFDDSVMVTVRAVAVTFGGQFSGGVTEDGPNTATGSVTATNDVTRLPADIVEQTDADSISMYGTFTVTDTATGGTWTYTLDNTNSVVNALPDAGSLMDTFTVAAVDGGTQDITIAITGANDPPVAAIDSPTDGTQVDFGATVTLTGSATDPDSLSDLTYRWSTVPANRGSFTTNTGRTGVWVAPTSGTAPVTMRLLVIDTFFPGVTNSAQITLNPTETAVTFAGDTTGGVNEGDTTQITGDLDATTTSDDAATDVVAQSGTSGLYGTFTIDTDGMWTYTLDNTNAAINALAEDATLDDPFTVTAEANAAATQVITITITGVNDAPTASITTPAPSLSGTLTFVAGQRVNLVGTQTDVDVGNTFTYAWTANPATGSFANSTVATTTYHPPAVEMAEDHTLTLTVTDNDGGSDTDTFVLEVTEGPGVSAPGLDDEDPATSTDDPPQVTTATIDADGNITGNTGRASGMLMVARIPTDQTGTPLLVTHSILTQPTYGIASIDDAALTSNVGDVWNYRLVNNEESMPFGPGSDTPAPAEDTFMVQTTIGPDIVLTSTITVALTEAAFPNDSPDIILDVDGVDVDVNEGGVYTMNVEEGDPVTLDASPTRNPEGGGRTEDGDVQIGLTFTWAYVGDDPDFMFDGGVGSDPPVGSIPMVTFTAPDERTTLEFTLMVTDTDTPLPRTATARVTVRVGRTSERALQKTLAAFGRAFAAGTVSVFEDYLTTPATSANTSHFTIGGHKFDMATTTPSAPVGTDRDLSALTTPPSFPNDSALSFPNDRKTGSTTPLSFPNDRKTGSDSDHVFHRIGNPVEHDLANTINSANLASTTTNGANTSDDATATTTLMSGQDLLMKSAFHLNLNNAAPGTPSWSLWARATTGNFDGKPEDDFDLNGDVTSAYLGADYRTPTGVRLGVAISETSGEVDYADTSADNAGEGDLDADLTSILPYIQWQPTDTTNAWVVLGYGEGDAELTDDRGPTEVDIEMQMLAAGVSGDLTTYNRTEWSWKASAFTVELESDKNVAADLPAVDADAQRLRAAIQGRIPGQPSANGTQLVPHWELGLRWDDGDAETGTGADLGLGFDYRHPSTGWTIQAQAKTLLTHEESDYKEWTAGIQARLDPGAQGRGITFTLTPGWTNDTRTQQMGIDFSNALGKWTTRGLQLELTGQRTEKTDDNIGHNIRLTGSLRF